MGKKIAIIFGVLVLALMVFMLTSQPSAKAGAANAAKSRKRRAKFAR